MKQDVKKRVEEAIDTLRQGGMIVVMDDESRENEGDLVMAAEKATPEAINFMIKEGRGLVCVPMSESRARHLNLEPMVHHNEDTLKTAFTVSVDYQSVTTGISAPERALTIQELANREAKALDFKRPGHIFPLIAKKGGVLERRGHTEASVDMVGFAGLSPIAVICEIVNDDGEMARAKDLQIFVKKHQLPFITIQEIVDYKKLMIAPLSEANLPTEYGDFYLYTFPNLRSAQGDILDEREPHLALVKKGTDFSEPIILRIHSECLTGDIFHSLKCDCHAQLDYGLHTIAQADHGILLYMRQEGRGIGLVEKIRAYALQERGFNTIDANVELGFDVDAREYDEVLAMLNYFGVNQVKLITNNEQKVAALKEGGIEVIERLATPRFETRENRDYLNIKEEKMGHHFSKTH